MAQKFRRDPGFVTVVAGDVALDWHLAWSRGSAVEGSAWNGAAYASYQPGGAALLGDLLRGLAATMAGPRSSTFTVHSVAVPKGPVFAGDERFHHSYALWSKLERSDGTRVWRVEEFLGLDRAPARGPGGGDRWARVEGDPASADLIVLDDAGMGFRERSDLWPRALSTAKRNRSWILLKMARPVAHGALWDRVLEHADRLVVVVRSDDLRLTEVQISREHSWERTAQDLMWELLHNPVVNDLSRCARVIISFDTAGALLLSSTPGPRGTSAPRGVLYFDPVVMEDMWTEEHPGGVIGYTCCLTAAIAHQVMRSAGDPNFGLGVQRGLAAMRDLHLLGYQQVDPKATRPRLGFPVRRVIDELSKEEFPFAEAVVTPRSGPPTPGPVVPGASDASFWTILQDRYPEGLGELAEGIVERGAEAALDGVPLGSFGKLLTVDRYEIEGYRSIRSLIREYSRASRPGRPLSIGVFGPPGAGKSFGIEEVAGSVLPDRLKTLTFNLSQFDEPRQLLDAFHQVRDESLRGLLPLVFWDEFDTTLPEQPLGWLRHFLSPMQDGRFQEAQITHPIGPAVFVFAGGTSPRLEEFGASLSDLEFRQAKGPDFVSRLKGFVDVLGPNPRSGGKTADPHYLIRRAILLRSMVQRHAGHLLVHDDGVDRLEIDPGVLQAFLLTREYRHGARSMEAILTMSLLAGKTRFERSSLPSAEQLELHVDASDFLALVHGVVLKKDVLESLAEAAHIRYCAGELARGLAWAESSDAYLRRHDALRRFADRKREGRKTHPTLVSYAKLAQHEKEQNRSLARDIPDKLAAAGYAMRRARKGDSRVRLSDREIEMLSELEHERWMRLKLADGWSYGPKRDEGRRLHPALRTWARLSGEEKVARYGELADRVGPGPLPKAERDKDRRLIRGVEQILAIAGYAIVKVQAVARGRRPAS